MPEEPEEVTTSVVPTPEPTPPDVLAPVDASALVALNAGEMPSVQQNLIRVCDQRLAALRVDFEDARKNYDHAVKRKWASAPFKRLMTRWQKQITYYEKIRRAVELGCVVIPPLAGAEVVAIRTKRKNPRSGTQTVHRNWVREEDFTQLPEGLPIGEGRYVSPNPSIEVEHIGTDDRDRDEWLQWADGFLPVEFPIAVVNPRILEAMGAAEDLKLFDSICVIRGQTSRGETRARDGDPVLVGHVRDPRGTRWSRPGLYFFLAWFMRPEDI